MATDRLAARQVLQVPEAFVAWLWEHRQLAPELMAASGQRVQVIFPGRRGGGWGPDFRGALIAIDGIPIHGDVEVHLRTRDWRHHRHDRDPAYGATVLHVVLTHDAGVHCRRADGTEVITVALERALLAPLPWLLARWRAAPRCAAPLRPCRTAAEAAALLEAAGRERLEAHAARFEADLTVVPPEQALWAGLCDALGYTRNRTPFRDLADRVTAAEAGGIVRQGPEQIMAVLLGEAGLLPHQRGRLPMDDYSLRLERLWADTGRAGPAGPLGWCRVGVRPANQPVRRVAAAGSLAGILTASFEDQVNAVLRTTPAARAGRALAELIAGVRDPYWEHHGDLGVPLRRPTALIGMDRASEIVVNVVLPWAIGVARTRAWPALEHAALAAYHQHPRLPGNAITRYMEHQLLGPDARRAVSTACRQQGLHQLFARWCDRRDCARCAAGERFAANTRPGETGGGKLW